MIGLHWRAFKVAPGSPPRGGTLWVGEPWAQRSLGFRLDVRHAEDLQLGAEVYRHEDHRGILIALPWRSIGVAKMRCRPGGDFASWGARVTKEGRELLITVAFGPDEDLQHRRIFRPVDATLGPITFDKRLVWAEDRVLEMPEGTYDARVTVEHWRQNRRMLPRLRAPDVGRYVVHVDLPKGLPIPGKGENDYDLDDDEVSALIMSTDYSDDPETAITTVLDQLRADVLDERKRGGWAIGRVGESILGDKS